VLVELGVGHREKQTHVFGSTLAERKESGNLADRLWGYSLQADNDCHLQLPTCDRILWLKTSLGLDLGEPSFEKSSFTVISY
jgi:hypothetical protein